jgi:serine protease inhibitor
VNEEGAEAAAATAVIMYKALAIVKYDYIDFIVDQPFLFMIRDK